MEVRNEVVGIISQYVEIPAEKIDTAEGFKFTGALDSFAVLSLIAALEERFNISIPDSELTSFRTIDDIITYVEKAA